MNIKRGAGSLQLGPVMVGNACCHVCLAPDSVRLLRFNSPRREQAAMPREPGSVFVRLCPACCEALTVMLAKELTI